MGDAATDSFRTFQCRTCLGEALICRKCDRGNCYCSPNCARKARILQLRSATRRYQTTGRGAENHRQRQRQYRKSTRDRENSPRVTHHSSLRAPATSHSPHDTQELSVKRCCVCGTISNGVTRLGRLRSIEGKRYGYKQRSRRRNNSPPPC